MLRPLTFGLLLLAIASPRATVSALELGTDRLGIRETGLESPGSASLEPLNSASSLRPAWHAVSNVTSGLDERDVVASLASLLNVPWATSSLESRLLDDATEGRLDQWALVEAALVAGGVKDVVDLNRYSAQMKQWSVAALAADRPREATRKRAANVLELMHARIMPRGYQIDATDLTAVLDHGQFNCVSATVLFMAISAELGLHVTAIELPTHAFCRVTAGDETFDVEPTCRRWFDVIDDPQARAAVSRRIAGPSGDGAAAPRTVSSAQLLAVIYYNRGVDLIRRGDDTGAIVANLRAMSLDPQSATARGNLWVAVNNSALGQCRDQRFSAAAGLISRARQAVPHHAALKANELYIYQQWSAELCRQNRLTEAMAVLDAGLARQPESEILAARRIEIQKSMDSGRGGK